jgi:hypothetical protein
VSHDRSRSLALFLFVPLLVLLVPSCGEGDEDGRSATTATSSTTTTTAQETTSTDEPAASVVRAYFLRAERVGPVGRDANGTDVAADAMEGLLAGPTSTEQQLGFSTTVPDGTALLGVRIDDQIATVDLSREFTTGGGSASMMGRIAQVVYTLTQFPTVAGVRFEIEGEPLTVLGGEGIMLDTPQTRADWEDLTPAILIESPLPFEEVRSPLRVTGTANTFEAVFQLTVTDGEGLIVHDEAKMATSGTGTRGTFDVTATFDVPRAGVGAVIVFEHSAKDGSPINLVEVPVRIS